MIQNLVKNSISQRSEQWYNIRKKLITASDIPYIITNNRYKSKRDVLLGKINTVITESSSIAINYGIKFEPIANEVYSKIYDETVHEIGLVKHPNISWLGASPDGIISKNNEVKLLEIKCLHSRNMPVDPYIEHWIQVQIQLEVTNLEKCELFYCKFAYYDSHQDYLKCSNDHRGIILSSDKTEQYWKLSQYRKFTIIRDQSWFNNKCLNKISKFYNDVQHYKKDSNLRRLKRKRSLSESESSDVPIKRTRNYDKDVQYLEEPAFSEWINVVNYKNYLLNDKILDWFNLYGEKKGYVKDSNVTENEFYGHLKKNKDAFKKLIVQRCRDTFGKSHCIEVDWNSSNGFWKAYDKTLKAIESGKICIVGGILCDLKERKYGASDILLRSDQFNKIFNNFENSGDFDNDLEDVIENNLEDESNLYGHHTYTLINLESKVVHLLKKDNIISSKRDNLPLIISSKILTDILNKIQKHNNTKSFVLSKYYFKNNEKIINNCGSPMIAKIDTKTSNDLYEDVVSNGTAWIKYLRTEGHNLNIYNLSDPKFINMKNTFDYPWHSAKKQIASKNNEITMIWKGHLHGKEECYRKGIYSWKDPRFSGKFFSKKHFNTIDQIVKVNKMRMKCFLPSKIKNINNKEVISSFNEDNAFFIDLEFLSNDNNSAETSTKINMIGVYHKNTYTYFWAYSLSDSDQERIIRDLVTYINLVSLQHNITEPRFYHWSHVDEYIVTNALKKYNINLACHWVDIMKIFISEPIIIRGVYNFKLKNIVSKLEEYGLIESNYSGLNCKDGVSALFTTIKYYKYDLDILEKQGIKNDIVNYNEVDCIVLSQIMKFIRSLGTT